MTCKLGILTTHPIQYKVPWYRALQAREDVDLTVFFAMLPDQKQQGEGFGVAFQWDIPLLEGYRYEVLENIAPDPSVVRFDGCDTPGIDDVVRDGNFDAFIVNGWVVKSCVQVARSCRRHGVPCIVRGESNGLAPRSWLRRLRHRWLLRRYDAFLYIGQANRRFYRQNGIAEDRLFFAPYCVENDRFHVASDALRPTRAQLRAKWGIPLGAFTFLFCGKFEPKKRPMDVIDAIRRVGDRAPVHALMVGDGALRSQCEATVKAEGLPVTFAGFLNQSEMPSAYVAADALALPSDYGETWGLVVNEAMACGLPAVVSDHVGCTPDLILPGETGATFPFASTQALAETMVAVASNPERAAAMGLRAREHIARYSVSTLVEGTLAALRFCTEEPVPVGAQGGNPLE